MITAVLLASFSVLILMAGSGRSAGRSSRSIRPEQPRDVVADDDPKVTRHRGRHFLTAAMIGAVFVVAGPMLALAAVAGVLAFPRVRAIQSTRRHRRRIVEALPDAIELLVLVIHAGLTPHQAVAHLAERSPIPTRPAFVEVVRRTERGSPLAEALGALPELLGPTATGVADTLAMAERHGTPISQAVEQLSFDVRERRQRHAEAAARQLPIRLSFPLVSCTLPSFVLIAIVPAVLGALTSLNASGF